MKIKFTATEGEMIPYKEALRKEYLVTLPGVKGKHVMNRLKITQTGLNEYELTVEYGKVAKSGKSKKDS